MSSINYYKPVDDEIENDENEYENNKNV